MKQSLQLRLHQQLTLTPQLQQSIRLLQLSTLELSQEITQMLQDNPMLERADGDDHFEAPANGSGDAPAEEAPSSRDDIYDEMAWGDRGVTSSNNSQNDDDDDERGFQQADAAQDSLQQHLLGQIALTPLTQRDRQLLLILMEALDDDGYLSTNLDEIAEMLPEELELDPLELSAALKLLQSLDPVGVGARDLGECLRLQLDALPEDIPYRDVARNIVSTQIALLGEREYGKLKKAHNLSDAEFIQVRQLITSLNPRPGAAYSAGDTRYVSPDVFVRKVRGLWVSSLNPEAMPKLRINEMYASILRGNREGGAGLTAQLQEARWLIKNVHQRFETILKVSQAIVDRQRMFFEHGEVAMKPLTLKEIAEAVDLHESTISRVTTQKYMMTPRGLFEFKHFFARALATEDGGSASNTAIRALIKQLVEAENRTKPLSDSTIAELLGKQGLVVARRTVAKYRELMNIPPANQRKSI
jgi:RNA polymerase sigma-54 factor